MIKRVVQYDITDRMGMTKLTVQYDNAELFTEILLSNA